MARTAKEAREKVCILVLVNPNEKMPVACCPEACSAWSWDSGGKANEERLGHCVLAGEAACPRPEKRKAG